MSRRSRDPAIELSVDRDSDIPLATQLAWKLRTLIATGRLDPGARLPGVREVAESAGVNVNTVRGVYGRLEEEGLVSSEHGRGTFVAADAGAQARLADIAAEAAAAASAAGVSLRDVAAALFVGEDAAGRRRDAAGRPARGPDERSRGTRSSGERSSGERSSGEQTHRRGLRYEIARLERELAYVEGLTGEPLPGPTTSASGTIPTTTELEAIRNRLAERLVARREDLEQIRRDVMAARFAPDEPAGAPAPGRRPKRHPGVSTGTRVAGVAGVVWTRG